MLKMRTKMAPYYAEDNLRNTKKVKKYILYESVHRFYGLQLRRMIDYSKVKNVWFPIDSSQQRSLWHRDGKFEALPVPKLILKEVGVHRFTFCVATSSKSVGQQQCRRWTTHCCKIKALNTPKVFLQNQALVCYENPHKSDIIVSIQTWIARHRESAQTPKIQQWHHTVQSLPW